jgi:hypothetical protein
MPDQPSLPYRDSRDDLPERRGNAASFIAGFAVGAAIVVFVGCANFEITHIPVPPPTTGTTTRPTTGRAARPLGLPLAFAAVGIAAVAGGLFLLRSERRRWMLVGFLLGIGVTSLLEGLCFYNG